MKAAETRADPSIVLHGTLTKSITSVPVRRCESRFLTPPVRQADIRADESSDKEPGREEQRHDQEMSGEGGKAADIEAGEAVK